MGTAEPGLRQPVGSRQRIEQTLAGSAHRGLLATLRTSPLVALVVVIGALAASWAVSQLVGGAGTVVPHWYYLPIVFTAVRFGHRMTFLVALTSAVLAGPLTPQVVAAGVPQSASEMVTRGVFFVVVGQITAALVKPSLPRLTDEVELLQADRRLRAALRDGQVEVHYQPLIRSADERVTGVEALVRWIDPDEGVVPAGRFMPTAERCAVIHELDQHVLETACLDAAEWDDRLGGDHADGDGERIHLSVNLSAAGLSDPDIGGRVRHALQRSGLDPSLLRVEVTEQVVVDDVATAISRLADLERLGVAVAIDDFGTGFSSLSYVHRLPADVLKIDKSFIDDVARSAQASSVVGGVVMLARSLGMTTVAEGVETADQAREAADLGCDELQGFGYARPMPAEEVVGLLGAQVPLRDRLGGARD